MKQISYFEIDPGGNVTALVPVGEIPSQKKKIALAILHSNPRIEQVGFVLSAHSRKGVVRLEMAGGEFCVNAARACAALCAQRRSFYVSVSGYDEVLRIRASRSRAAVELPLKVFECYGSICRLPGIVHVVKSGRIDREDAGRIMSGSHLLGESAAGVIGYDRHTLSTFELFPVVWVRELNTHIAETACGSGTAALAYIYWLRARITRLDVIQPSGAIFRTCIREDVMSVEGPVRSVRRRKVLFNTSLSDSRLLYV